MLVLATTYTVWPVPRGTVLTLRLGNFSEQVTHADTCKLGNWELNLAILKWTDCCSNIEIWRSIARCSRWWSLSCWSWITLSAIISAHSLMLFGLSLLHSLRGQSRLLTVAYLLQAGLYLLLILKYQSVLPTWGSFAAGGQLSPLQSQRPIYAVDSGSFAAGRSLSLLQSHRPICWWKLICCRWGSLSSAVSDANLHCWLRLICCM